MLKLVLVLAVLAVLAILFLAFRKPDTFRVHRSTTIKAPPENIFALINDFHLWESWSPYEKKDPSMKRTFGGTPNGKGATYEWDGDKNVGKGRMEILESTPPTKVGIKLDFFVPFEAHNIAEFTMESQVEATRVTWSMYGPAPFVSKVVQVFMDMDKMVGADFEAGLANLKNLTEK